MKFTLFFSLIIVLFSASSVLAEENQTEYIFKMKYDNNITLFNYDDNFDTDNIKVVSENLNIFKSDFETVNRLKELGLIEKFEENADIHLSSYDSYNSYNDKFFDKQWYFKEHNLDYVKKVLGKGKGIRVAIIDSGVTLHPDFNINNIEEGYNYINPNKTGNQIDSNDSEITKNHGTQVASIICSQSNNKVGIAGIAEDVTIVPFVVIQSGTGNTEHIIKAIEGAVEYNCDVINLSLDVNLKSELLQETINYANKNKIIIIAASGNKRSNQPNYLYPACCENVISVGSIDSDFKVSSFSKANDYVDISAAGSGFILADSYGGYNEEGYNNKDKLLNGTSYSSPIIAGFAALIKEKYPYIDSELFLKALKAGSKDINSVGYDNYSGFGAFDAKESLRFIEENYDFFVSPVYSDDLGIKVKVFGNLSGVLFFTVYDKNEKLKYFNFENFKTEDEIFCKNFDYIVSNDDKIKIFAFDNIYNMVPLGKVRFIENLK